MDNTIIIEEGEKMYKKIETLKKVRVDGNNWKVYYIDEVTGVKWVEEYPHSEFHGGGPSQLRLLHCFPWEENRNNVSE